MVSKRVAEKILKAGACTRGEGRRRQGGRQEGGIQPAASGGSDDPAPVRPWDGVEWVGGGVLLMRGFLFSSRL